MGIKVKLSLNDRVSWKNDLSHGTRSAARYPQLLGENSHTSLFPESLVFILLHNTFPNFNEGVRRRNIVDGSTLLTYLPVNLDALVNNGCLEEKRRGLGRTISWIRTLAVLHERIEFSL